MSRFFDRLHGLPRGRIRGWWLLGIVVAWFLLATGGFAQHDAPADGHDTAAVSRTEGEHDDHAAGGHTDPVAAVLLEIVIVLVAARLGGHVAEVIKQPPVLGELVAGVAIGSLALFLPENLLPGELIQHARTSGSHIDILARIGVILLLFEVGLESTVEDMMKVGVPALIVAVVGVVCPMALGYVFGEMFLHDVPEGISHVHMHLFMGAALCATSVGITARVLTDLNRVHLKESRIVLGAAVIDDVLGLIVLAAVSGVITAARSGAEGSIAATLAITTAKAVAFLAVAVIVGGKLVPLLFGAIARLRGSRLILTAALGFCFVISWLANAVGLATIVGAFAAGLIITDKHLTPFRNSTIFPNGHKALHEKVGALATFLVPVFFVQMGIQVDLTTFADPTVLTTALLLTGAAIAGKLVCALAAKGNIWQRLAVGVGMIPRGEVGLIFANIGLGLGVVTPGVFSAIVIMVVLTTFVTPPILKICLSKIPRGSEEEGHGAAAAGTH